MKSIFLTSCLFLLLAVQVVLGQEPGGNTLDQAYDQGGPGAGRTITADSGAVKIAGPNGLEVDGTIKSGRSIAIDGINNQISASDTLEFLEDSDKRALRLEPATFMGGATQGFSPNIIGGFSGNSVGNGVISDVAGATISGGGVKDAENKVFSDGGTIGGGFNNIVIGPSSTIGGGVLNRTFDGQATVAGGAKNTAHLFATVGGGESNTASGQDATVPGGSNNEAAGATSFAAGRRAKAKHDGTFVWADKRGTVGEDFISTGANQFLIRASGGVGIGTNSPSSALHVVGGNGIYGQSTLNGVNGFGGEIGVTGSGQFFDFHAQGPGVNFGATSSIRWKRNISQIDNALDKILKIRGVYFNWNEEHGGRHDMGFIAEEVGEYIPEIVVFEPDGKYARGLDYGAITPILVEAIKEQQIIIKEQNAEIAATKAKLDQIKAELNDLKSKMALLVASLQKLDKEGKSSLIKSKSSY